MKVAARLSVMWIPAILWACVVIATQAAAHIWIAAHVQPLAGKPLADFSVIVLYIAPMFLILWAGNRIGMHFWPRDLAGPAPRSFAGK